MANVLWLLALLFLLPLVLFVAYLILSSCMGDNFRARISGTTVTPRTMTFGREYSKGLGSGASHSGWEQIEMEDMMGEDVDLNEEEDEERYDQRFG